MSSKEKESNKLVRYEDVCAALIPILEDMLEMGNFKPVTDTIEALVALKEVDLTKEIQTRCLKYGDDCESCEFHGCHNVDGCFWLENDNTPEGWRL